MELMKAYKLHKQINHRYTVGKHEQGTMYLLFLYK